MAEKIGHLEGCHFCRSSLKQSYHITSYAVLLFLEESQCICCADLETPLLSSKPRNSAAASVTSSLLFFHLWQKISCGMQQNGSSLDSTGAVPPYLHIDKQASPPKFRDPTVCPLFLSETDTSVGHNIGEVPLFLQT
jgi:hypothetical protein